MASTQKKTTKGKKAPPKPEPPAYNGVARLIGGIVCLLLALCVLVSYFNVDALLLTFIAKALKGTLGCGYYLAAPALLGGVTLSWMHGEQARTASLRVAEDALAPLVLLPDATLSTHAARGLLPAEVPHRDAAFTAARAALLVHALAAEPELLLEATEERLHQEQRGEGMPESLELLRVLRQEGHPAVISGAGPSVLVMRGRRAELAPLVRRVVGDPRAWRLAEVPLRVDGARCVVD